MRNTFCSVLLAMLAVPSLALAQEPAVKIGPARHEAPGKSMVLDVARAGKRIVAVGERGHVLLSDDNGATFRQASAVPVDLTLTAVTFVDDRNGWAVGHGGTVLHTGDGGDHWTVQRQDLAVDQPLFSVYFRDADTGWATGLWSLLLATTDGGKTWTKVALTPPEGQKRADLNLLQVFEGQGGRLFIAAEQGVVLSSDDNGKSWRYNKSGSAASLWAGAAGQGTTGIVAGLRGHILRTDDNGASWKEVASPVEASITHIVRKDHAYWVSTVNGAVLRSADDGRTWSVAKQYGTPVTALLPVGDARVLAFSKQGVLRDARPAGVQAED
jgi:photosystem II stability/assembly factor-like uncharacterized protein